MEVERLVMREELDWEHLEKRLSEGWIVACVIPPDKGPYYTTVMLVQIPRIPCQPK